MWYLIEWLSYVVRHLYFMCCFELLDSKNFQEGLYKVFNPSIYLLEGRERRSWRTRTAGANGIDDFLPNILFYLCYCEAPLIHVSALMFLSVSGLPWWKRHRRLLWHHWLQWEAPRRFPGEWYGCSFMHFYIYFYLSTLTLWLPKEKLFFFIVCSFLLGRPSAPSVFR